MQRKYEKFAISMCEKTLAKVEQFSDEHGLNRSAAISLLVNTTLNERKVDVSKLSQEMREELLFQLLDELDSTGVYDLDEDCDVSEIKHEMFTERIFEKILSLGFEVKQIVNYEEQVVKDDNGDYDLVEVRVPYRNIRDTKGGGELHAS